MRLSCLKLQEISLAMEGWEALTSELRAASEWELLLSDSMLEASIDNDSVIHIYIYCVRTQWKRRFRNK